MIRRHDSSALKDIIHMNNKVLLLLNMILWDLVMSHLEIPIQPDAGGWEGGGWTFRFEDKLQWRDLIPLGHPYTYCRNVTHIHTPMSKFISSTYFHCQHNHLVMVRPKPSHLGAASAPVCPPALTPLPEVLSSLSSWGSLRRGKEPWKLWRKPGVPSMGCRLWQKILAT